jgi:hypothetical protein
MFKEMRRRESRMSGQEAVKVLEEGLYGNLATVGEEGYPYLTPLNYVYADNIIYFHSAPEGHKLENIKFNDRVCFSVVGRFRIIPEKFDTNYDSVVVFGKVGEVTDEEEKKKALMLLVNKYSKDYMDEGRQYIERSINRVSVFKIDIEHLTGKRGK